jgi:hypothetical protein
MAVEITKTEGYNYGRYSQGEGIRNLALASLISQKARAQMVKWLAWQFQEKV